MRQAALVSSSRRHMSSMMVFMVTLVATYLNLGLRPDFVLQWAKAYIVAWPIAAVTGLSGHADGAALHRSRHEPDRRRRLMLSALADLARAIEAGELTPAQAVELCAEAIAERESEVGAFVTLDLDGARKAAQTPRPQGQAAARPAGRAQGHFRHRRHADRIRLADLCRLPAEGRRLAGGADPPRRRHADRQDRHHRVRPSRSGQDPQPAQPRAHAGRLVVGLGGGRRRGLLSDRDRHARPAAR